MKLSKIIAFYVVVPAICLAAVLAVSREANDAVVQLWHRTLNDPGQACFDFERQNFKDPYSARMDSYIVDRTNANVVLITYHAKNSYGAYVPGESQCVVRAGKVDESSTQTHRLSVETNKAIEKIDVENKCLEAQIKLQYAGKSATEAKKLACPGAN